MNLPICKHRKAATAPIQGLLPWLASEPFRLFFLSGALWSLVGVSLWPLYYAGQLSFHPGITHARLMIQSFGAAFVVGFLATAGPRMAAAPKITTLELLALFTLHTAIGVFHLMLKIREADLCFVGLLSLLLLSLVVRILRFRKEAPPPQMLLALTGLICGIAGSCMWWHGVETLQGYRLAGLFVYQGLLLPPVLGISSFIFPRILGGDFGSPKDSATRVASLWRTLVSAALIVANFFIEAAGHPLPAGLLRAATAAAYLLIEVNWRRAPGHPPRGTLAKGLFWAILTGLAGLAATAFAYDRRVALEHLLFIGTFGLLIFIVSSRVLFGHSGELPDFEKRSWPARLLIFFAILAATTRASAEFWPKITVSHHLYAAWTWILATLIWLIWHSRRFLKRGDEG